MSSKIDFTTIPGNYSTSELKTEFTWIDGKVIYKKTINFGALPNATSKTVNHNITNISEIVKIEGIAKSAQNNFTPLPFVPAAPTSLCDLSVNNTRISMTAQDNRSTWQAYITVYYTKTS